MEDANYANKQLTVCEGIDYSEKNKRCYFNEYAEFDESLHIKSDVYMTLVPQDGIPKLDAQETCPALDKQVRISVFSKGKR